MTNCHVGNDLGLNSFGDELSGGEWFGFLIYSVMNCPLVNCLGFKSVRC